MWVVFNFVCVFNLPNFVVFGYSVADLGIDLVGVVSEDDGGDTGKITGALHELVML